ncbi:hypothetical protein NOC27_2969 [Nitrosococcus oceani AFC27]|nr:hypothetical protein NOC27_2969 [Nitrosococcus oceani AFC27]
MRAFLQIPPWHVDYPRLKGALQPIRPSDVAQGAGRFFYPMNILPVFIPWILSVSGFI